MYCLSFVLNLVIVIVIKMFLDGACDFRIKITMIRKSLYHTTLKLASKIVLQLTTFVGYHLKFL